MRDPTKKHGLILFLLSVAIITLSMCLNFELARAQSTIDYAKISAGQGIYASKGCIGCHGLGGNSQTNHPKLTGKTANEIRQALLDYRSGNKPNEIMNMMAALLSDTDIENIAVYLSSQKP